MQREADNIDNLIVQLVTQTCN